MSGGEAPPEPPRETCTAEGMQRCAAAGAGAREVCMGGAWMEAPPCAANQICTTSASGLACSDVVDVCRGSGGKNVCNDKGTLFMCNADGTSLHQESCKSPALCEAGLAVGACATCVSDVDYRCTGATLEVCAADGMTFQKKLECETAALCNTVAMTCTTATCAPNKITCQDNVLLKCNADGTDFAEMTPCGQGTCDAKGGDCNVCTPGQKKCDGAAVATCNAAGQAFDKTACGGGEKCVGAGQCVECAADADCSALTKGCVVGACVSNMCTTKNALAATKCTAAGNRPGTCSSGMCVCTPQCTKDCGADGCGGTCPNKCGSKMCVGDACVDCADDGDCASDPNRCKVGECNDGVCSQTDARDGVACGSGGHCRSGSCCTPNCAGKCSGSDGCGGTCPNNCSGDLECVGGTCQPTQSCGDRKVSGTEGCDPTAVGFNEFNCSRDCEKITAYTQCGPGWPECLNGTVCNLGMCSRPCSTSSDCDVVDGQPGIQAYCPVPRGTTCVIGCMSDQDCPPSALCNGGNVCEIL